jgi:hypothetical protein
MALKVEGVVDGGMHAEEALGRSSRFEPLHLALYAIGQMSLFTTDASLRSAEWA